MRTVFAALAVLVIGFSTSGHAAPFGLKMGARPPDFTILRDNRDGTVVLSTVPRAFPGLSHYFARFDASHGLCSVAGSTKPFENDPLGIAVRDYFVGLERRLNEMYGRSKAYNFAKPGDNSVNAGSWVEAVATRERVVYTFWNADAGSRLKFSVRSIALSIGASADHKPFVMLQFDFENYPDCERTQRIREAMAL
ncbi:hypothetical protein FPY71_00265 [Aureimonas fodinaquatilis]|uniref:DUF1795 domain-containing protein n=1 Tax=Aureimonas fodinaquatilis TaxID=2565783 RepID=A0A5B0E0X9_9HYPH|nr:hypothetical protein [Aureimonas fodinaquatilis]KAA0971611.1 hypothetical protein FPY71_00265 [Aureimonas fodinaquatilis]